jgi:signal transduction histidine kinase
MVLFFIWLSPSRSDLYSLTALLALTSVISAGVGFLSHRMGWWRRLPSLSHALTIGYVIAAVLTVLNVWLTARLMFINQHDLALAILLQLFASGISISFGMLISSSITQNLIHLADAAESLSKGDYSIQVPVSGGDELAQLTETFNSMVLRLGQIHEAERALENARKNLVAWASHDLRTPLASMKAMLESIEEGVVSDPETVSRYIHQSQLEIERMSKLIDDLFELAQLDAGYLELHGESSSLRDLLSDSIEAFRVRAEARGVQLGGAVDANIDPVWMAPEKINRVLANLLENALRHTQSGDLINLGAVLVEDMAVVEVRDTGEGIPEEDLPYVFDRFFRGEHSRRRTEDASGAGLGLAIAKGLVNSHGGSMNVESTFGEGTAISFSLPRKRLRANSPQG